MQACDLVLDMEPSNEKGRALVGFGVHFAELSFGAQSFSFLRVRVSDIVEFRGLSARPSNLPGPVQAMHPSSMHFAPEVPIQGLFGTTVRPKYMLYGDMDP